MKITLSVFGLLLAVFAIFVAFFSPSTLPISPLGLQIPIQNSQNNHKNNYVIFGFAPYWNLKKLTSESLDQITHFAYFNLLLKEDGSLYTKVNSREEDPSYTNYKRLLLGSINRGTKPLIITFMPESQAALVSSISSLSNRQKTIATILKIFKESAASGVNIDYEPLGDIDQSTRNNFTLFIKELHSELLTTGSQLSISIYSSAASRPRLWDLASLTPYTDFFVVMTYDYTMPGNTSSGPNAPLRGSPHLFEHDITKNIAEIAKIVPNRKILLGIPFYGYEWETVDKSKYSTTQAKGSTASLERVQKMLDDKTLELIWDRNSLTPYGLTEVDGKISQVYFENETSLRLKLEFVKSANLGGIAIWALGYEGPNSWVWPTIRELNN